MNELMIRPPFESLFSNRLWSPMREFMADREATMFVIQERKPSTASKSSSRTPDDRSL